MNRIVAMLEFLLNFTNSFSLNNYSCKLFKKKKTFCSGNNSLLWLTQDISFYTKLIYSNSFNPLLWATAGHRSSLRRRGVWPYPAKCGLTGLAYLWEHCSELSGRFSLTVKQVIFSLLTCTREASDLNPQPNERHLKQCAITNNEWKQISSTYRKLHTSIIGTDKEPDNVVITTFYAKLLHTKT